MSAGPLSRRGTGAAGKKNTRPQARKRAPSRFARWRSSVADRLARSSQVFLIGVIVACGVEVMVDWNATLFEINVLRDDMRQKGQNYVGILARASTGAMAAHDADGLDRLSSGLFDDEDVAYVLFSDAQGRPAYERLRPSLDEASSEAGEPSFRARYAAEIGRDVAAVLRDPSGLRGRIARSRHRDFVQAWNDAVSRLVAAVVRPRPAAVSPVIYQDRLSGARGGHDSDVTYALGTVAGEKGEPGGVVLVAFSMSRTNAAIRAKYLKGAGMVAFFVALILVQNVLGRRDKLKLLDLEARHAWAKQALREALPEGTNLGPLMAGAALDQAAGPVDGMVWDRAELEGAIEILVLDPDGDGIDAASTALHLLKVYRERRQRGLLASIDDEAIALGEAALVIPLTRPIGLVLVRIDASTGKLEALSSPLGRLTLIDDRGEHPVASEPAAEPPRGVVGPLRRAHGVLPEGGLLCVVAAGMEGASAEARLDVEALAAFVARSRHHDGDLASLADDAVTWARGRSEGAAHDDLLVALVARPPSSPPAHG